MKKNNQLNLWVYAVIIAVVLLVVFEFISDKLINDSSISASVDGLFATFVSLFAAITFVICIFAILKTKKWLKAVPIIGMLIALVIFGLAFFAASFAGYGLPY